MASDPEAGALQVHHAMIAPEDGVSCKLNGIQSTVDFLFGDSSEATRRCLLCSSDASMTWSNPSVTDFLPFWGLATSDMLKNCIRLPLSTVCKHPVHTRRE
jgi:hypothetical protein